MHAELRVTQIESTHAQFGSQTGTDGAATGRVVADDEQLQRDAGLAGALLQHDDTGRVCGVALVGVDLDDSAAVHGGLVRGLVLASVVGVDGVGHVGGDEERARERLLKGSGLLALVVDLLVAAVAGGVAVAGEDGQAAQHRGQQVGVGTLGGLRTDLLVVEADGHADGGVVVKGLGLANGLDETLNGAIGHAQIVEARGEDELVVDAADDGFLRVVEDELEVDDGGDVGSKLVGNDVEHGGVVAHGHLLERLEVLVLLHSITLAGLFRLGALVELGGGKTRDGEQLDLIIGFEVGLAVQVNSQRGDSQQWLVDLDQLLHDAVTLTDQHAASKTQITVEPRVPYATAVGLDADLQVADVALPGDGLDSQAGRISVSADNGDGVAGTPLAADSKGEDGRAVAGEVVLAARAQG